MADNMTDIEIIATKLEQLTYTDLMGLANHLSSASNQYIEDGGDADDRYFADTLLYWANETLDGAAND